jgi:hypothetical protein
MSENPLKWTCDTVENELKAKGYNYLKTAARGNHIVIYTEEDGEKNNRSRLTKLKGDTFMLGMADRNGKWEPTPYEGDIKELISMLAVQFPWVLAKW